MSSPLTRRFWQFWNRGGGSARYPRGNAEVLQREFLPAALAVQDTPPSPLGRLLLWLLLSLFALSILWSALGSVDIVVTASGRIVPSGQVKLVQAIDAGLVRAIHVLDGVRVKAGEALITLDSTYVDADVHRISEQLAYLERQLIWRQALEGWLAAGSAAVPELSFSGSGSSAINILEETLYWQRRSEISATLLALQREIDANAADQEALLADRERAVATAEVLAERVFAYESLLESRYGSRVQYLELLQQQTDLEKSIPGLDARRNKLVRTAESLLARMKAMKDEVRNQNLLQLMQLGSERDAAVQEHQKVLQRQALAVLRAPVTGTVQELVLHTVGGVVSPAQTLMKIVPERAPVEVEVLLQNKDIGFIQKGQRAEIKVDTFNFTKYGLLDAVVVDVSKDAVEDSALGWVFKMRLRLESDQLTIKDQLVTLSSGMAVTAEVKTGRRRLLEFFLSPLLRYQQESVRER